MEMRNTRNFPKAVCSVIAFMTGGTGSSPLIAFMLILMPPALCTWEIFCIIGCSGSLNPVSLVMGVMHTYAVAYCLFGSVAYSQLGTDFEYDRPVTSLLPPGLWSNLANAGLLAHCIIAYMV